MGNAIPFDWDAFRDYFAGQTDVSATDELKRFERCRKFIVQRAHVSDPLAAGEAMIDLAAEFGLNWFRAARLYVRLQHLSSLHRMWRRDEAYERAGDAVKFLEEFRFSLGRLAKFSTSLLADDASPRTRTAKSLLESAARSWADGLHCESRAAGQYERWEEAKAHGFVEAEGYDAHVVLDTWLRCNVLFSGLLKQVSSNETPPRDKTREPSSVQSLDGVKLPKLYQQYTGDNIRVLDEERGELENTDGPRFASMCYRVMGLDPPPIETLRTHWQSREARDARDMR